MNCNLDKILKEKTDELVFFDLKGKTPTPFSDLFWPEKIAIPIMTKHMVGKIVKKESPDIPIEQILEGMVHILGIDGNFTYKDFYMKFMKRADAQFEKRILNDGLALAKKGNKKDALIRLRACLLFDEKQLDALYNCGRLCEEIAYEQEENKETSVFLEAAKDFFSSCLEVDSDFGLAAYHLGFYFVNEQAYGQAENIWTHAIKSGKLTEDQKGEVVDTLRKIKDKLIYERGYQAVIEGFPDQGLVDLEPLLEDHPEWWNLLFFVGLAYRKKEMYDEALVYFQRVLSLNTGHVETMNEMAICYMSMGKLEKAHIVLKEALRLQPQNHEILCNMGIVYLQKGEIDKAKKNIQKSLVLVPDDEVTQSWKVYLDHLEKV